MYSNCGGANVGDSGTAMRPAFAAARIEIASSKPLGSRKATRSWPVSPSDMKPWATRATRSARSAYESDPAEVWIAMACGDLAAASSSMAANVMGDPVSFRARRHYFYQSPRWC
jgi:hypothetical protein